MKFTKLVDEVNRILTEEWDPIGVLQICEDKSWAYTEYSSYAYGIAKMIREGADVFKINQHLSSLRENQMCMPANQESDRQVAQVLVSLK